MIASNDNGPHPPKLLAGAAVKFRIALVSGCVLTIGAWLAPRAAPTALSAPQEHAAPLLEEQAQLRETSRPFVGVQEAAASVRQHSVPILAPASPSIPSRNDYSESATVHTAVTGFGVFVSDAHLLTHTDALNGRSTVPIASGNGVTTSGPVVTYEPSTGLVLLQIPRPEGRPLAALAGAAPAPGALGVAVGQSGEQDLAVPVFVTGVGREQYTIGTVHDGLLPGMPVFNLTGELFAIVAPDGRNVRAIPVREAAARMLARVAAGERRSSFGLSFQMPAGQLVDVFGAGGVIVSDVLPGGPADAADIRVGDVLLAVGEVQIDSADTAARALTTAHVGSPTRLRIRRNRQNSDVEVIAALAYEVAALARANADTPIGSEARLLFSAAVLEASAIPASARVVTVNGRTLTTRAQVQRELRGARRPIPVLLRLNNRPFLAVLEPMR
jgi:S1-C subfamily serine protease